MATATLLAFHSIVECARTRAHSQTYEKEEENDDETNNNENQSTNRQNCDNSTNE